MSLSGEAPTRKILLVLAVLSCAAAAFDADAKSKREAKCERIGEPSVEPAEVIRKSKPKLNLRGGNSSRKKAGNCGKSAPEPIPPKQQKGGVL